MLESSHMQRSSSQLQLASKVLNIRSNTALGQIPVSYSKTLEREKWARGVCSVSQLKKNNSAIIGIRFWHSGFRSYTVNEDEGNAIDPITIEWPILIISVNKYGNMYLKIF